MADDGGSLKLSTPFGDIIAQGFQVVTLILLAGLTWLIFDLNKERQREHDRIDCLMKLSVYVYSQPRGAVIQPVDMPPEVWACIPEFMVRRK
jgi:hypothetical protein